MNQAGEPSLKRSRLILVLIFALFALPFTIAWVMNFVAGWMPQSTANHGELIEPVRPFDPGRLVNLQGEALDAGAFTDKWTLIYLHDGKCGEACHNALYMLRQVRLAQGKNIDRVARLTIINSAAVPAWAEEAQRHYPGMPFARLPADNGAVLEPFGAMNRIYIRDPMGNLMMRYPLDVEPDGMISDLERLLRISYVG